MHIFDGMYQTTNLLSLRLRQALRLINETGIGISILALFLLMGSILSLIEKMLMMDQVFSLVFVALIILAIDKIRNDKIFLSQILGGKTGMGTYLSTEYLLFLSPLVIYKLITGNLLIVVGIIATIVAFSFTTTLLTKPTNQGHKRSMTWIPLKYYELKFFVEKKRVAFIAIIILLFLGVIHISLWILGIFILIGSIMEIFAAQEPIEMIDWRTGFVASKIFAYSQIMLPPLIISSLLTFYMSDLSIWVYVYGISVIITALALAISNKYSEYYGLTDRIKSTLPITIIAFLMLIPGFIIVTIGYTILKYRKAESQMKKICSR